MNIYTVVLLYVFIIVYVHLLPRTTLLLGSYYELQKLSLASGFF